MLPLRKGSVFMDCKLKTGEYMIDGIKRPVTKAFSYLQEQGFTRGEALEYIKSLPDEV
jgi:hypothetical protein